MKSRRIERINALLREVLSEVIFFDLKHKNVPKLITITSVDTRVDIKEANVYVSLIEDCSEEREKALVFLQKMARYIARLAMKKVHLRYFPHLTFKIDTATSDYLRVEAILKAAKSF